MARKRYRNSSSRDEGLVGLICDLTYETLKMAPWWLGLLVVAFLWVVLTALAAGLLASAHVDSRGLLEQIGNIFAVVLGGLWVVAQLQKLGTSGPR